MRYEYKYTDTEKDERIEVEQSINDKPYKEIDGRPVKRVISGGGFLLKGTGFYKTDYGSKK